MLTGAVGASISGGPSDVRAEVADVLGVSGDTVDPTGNLISQGLDSIRMMSLAGKWRRRGVDVDFAALSAEPTIEAWSRLVAAGSGPPRSPMVRWRRRCPLPTALFRLRPCSTPCGWAVTTVNRWAAWPAICTLNSTALQSITDAWCGPRPRWRCGIRCCGCSFWPMEHSRSRHRPHTAYPVAVHDFRDLAKEAAGQRLIDMRHAKSHQQLDGQVFELTLSLLPGEKARFGVDLDMQAADAMSYRTLMTDLAALYHGRPLPELGYSYQEYRNEIVRREAGPRPAHDADRDWWSQRLPELPDPPALPSASRKALSPQ